MKILENRGTWYKGNLHMHTTMSDGELSPEAAIRRYRDAGYDFVALTDHRMENPVWEDEDFLVLTGAEYDTGHPGSSMPVYHILGIGMEHSPGIRYRSSYETRHPWPHAQDIINAIRSAGGIAVLAHPAWSVMTPAEMLDLHGFAAAEIYNTWSGLPWNPNRADASQYFDVWAKNGKLVNVMAGDDAHIYEGEECCAYIMVNASGLDRESVMEALRAGDYYASQGPAFYDIELEDGVVTVNCSSDVETVIFYSNSPWGRKNVQKPVRTGEKTQRKNTEQERPEIRLDFEFDLEKAGFAKPETRLNLRVPDAVQSDMRRSRLSGSRQETRNNRTLRTARGSADKLTARYITGSQERYVRIELISRTGTRAWSSPFKI